VKRTLVAVLIWLAVPFALAAGELRIFNWSEYIPEDVLAEFERRYDVRIIYDTFEAPEAMMAKLQAGGAREYDLVVPPDYYVAETPEGARWWVFRERRGARGWYLHGLFA